MREGVGHLLSDLKYFSNFFMCGICQKMRSAFWEIVDGRSEIAGAKASKTHSFSQGRRPGCG